MENILVSYLSGQNSSTHKSYDNSTTYSTTHISILPVTIYVDTCTVECHHRGPTQSVCVADCYFIVNVLDLPFASPIAIYR